MRLSSRMLAFAALLACSACANQPTTTTLVTPTNQQFSTVQWDDAIAARSVARVSNGGLISLR